METDEFEWDDVKAATNLKKHGVSFLMATFVFDDPFLHIEADVTERDEEERYLATGLVDGVLMTVIYTERDDRARIISARAASTHEQRAYHAR